MPRGVSISFQTRYSLFVIPYSEFFIEFNHKVYPDRAAKPEIPKKNKGQETQEDNECDIDR